VSAFGFPLFAISSSSLHARLVILTHPCDILSLADVADVFVANSIPQ